jgi:hypothetical protein
MLVPVIDALRGVEFLKEFGHGVIGLGIGQVVDLDEQTPLLGLRAQVHVATEQVPDQRAGSAHAELIEPRADR